MDKDKIHSIQWPISFVAWPTNDIVIGNITTIKKTELWNGREQKLLIKFAQWLFASAGV